MNILRSTITGLAAVLVATVVLPVLGLFGYTLFVKQEEGVAVGFDPIAAAKFPIVWLIAAMIFTAAFYWQFRRATRPR